MDVDEDLEESQALTISNTGGEVLEVILDAGSVTLSMNSGNNFEQTDSKSMKGSGSGILPPSRDDSRDGWLTVDPTTLTIEPGASADVTVTVDAEDLDLGDYSDIITITSNDPENGSMEVPVALSVIAQPQVYADFSAEQTSGYAPFPVNFTDLSTSLDSVISWEWDFDTDGTIDSYEQNPSYTYTEAGTYTVSLTVSDNIATDTETKADYITANAVSGNLIQGYAYLANHSSHAGIQVTFERTAPSALTVAILSFIVIFVN